MDPQRDEFLGAQFLGAQFLESNDGDLELRFPYRMSALVEEQIARDDPPEVWQTVCRLTAAGLDRREVMTNLVCLATWALEDYSDAPGHDAEDLQAYIAALANLPLPAVRVVADQLLEVAAEVLVAPADELVLMVLHELGEADQAGPTELWVNQVLEALLDSEGPLLMNAPDRVVHLEALTEGAVFTHRLSAAELDAGCLVTEVDLVALGRLTTTLRLASGDPVELWWTTEDAPVLSGPPGWLDRFAADVLLGVSWRGGVLTVEEVTPAPAPDREMVAVVRAAYERELAEPFLPVSAEEIVAGVLDTAPESFAEPRAPLSQLCEEAGLER
ncbi:MAG: hypothetical protein ACYDB7_15345, partial [Mycobacteriales bacterium]